MPRIIVPAADIELADGEIYAGLILNDDGSGYRAFVCHTLNQWNFPAKDRSGRLDVIEEPHLGRLMEKIAGPARPATERLDFARPAPAAIPESTSTQES